MKTDLNEVKNIINNHMNILQDSYKVKNIGVFGSTARKENTVTSDIDVLVEFSEPVGFFKFLDLEEFLGRIWGGEVDLVTKKALKPSIKKEILQDVIYV